MCNTKERRIKFLSVKVSKFNTFCEQLMILTNEDETVMQHTSHAHHVLVVIVLPIIIKNLFHGFGA